MQGTPSDPEEETLVAPSDNEKETLETSSDPEEETLEAPSDPDKETQGVPLDPEEIQKALQNLEGETQETPSDPGVETNVLKGPVVPTPWKLLISGNLPPNNVNAHVESTGARRRERRSAAKFSADS